MRSPLEKSKQQVHSEAQAQQHQAKGHRQCKGALVVLGGIKMLFWDRGYDEEYEKLAEETGAILIPNILNGLMGNVELMSDTIHPNAAGYEIMARRFHKAIALYL